MESFLSLLLKCMSMQLRMMKLLLRPLKTLILMALVCVLLIGSISFIKIVVPASISLNQEEAITITGYLTIFGWSVVLLLVLNAIVFWKPILEIFGMYKILEIAGILEDKSKKISPRYRKDGSLCSVTVLNETGGVCIHFDKQEHTERLFHFKGCGLMSSNGQPEGDVVLFSESKAHIKEQVIPDPSLKEYGDNLAVDQFARTMKSKMALARAKGRHGWDNPLMLTNQDLSEMFHKQVKKGDPVDIANFAMMLFHRGSVVLPSLKNSSDSTSYTTEKEH